MNVDIESLGPVPEGSLLLLRCHTLDPSIVDETDALYTHLRNVIGHGKWALVTLLGDDDLTITDPEIMAAALRVAGWTVTAP